MGLWGWVIVAGVGTLAFLLVLYFLARRLQRREPYATFLKLPTRGKITFFRRVIADRRVPWYVKAIPFVLAVYLALPIDLIPDFLPVLGHMDDVAAVLVSLALIIRLTPRAALTDIVGDVDRRPPGPND